MPPKQNPIKFEEGEKVLCFHGQVLYEAKCTKVDSSRANGKIYFIHYNGYNKKWDEWVDAKRMLKYSDENLAKQQNILNLVKKNKLKKEEPKETKETQPPEPMISTLKRKRTADSTSSLSDTQQKDSILDKKSTNEKHTDTKEIKKTIYSIDIYSKHNKYLTNPRIRIEIPQRLKDWLVDDFDAVTQQNKLVNLGKVKNVKQILDDYKLHKMSQDESLIRSQEFQQNQSGIINYFNCMLGSQLLYKFERVQYSELLESKVEFADVYGAIHLLRLVEYNIIEKLDQIILFAPLNESKLEALLEYVNDLLKYLDKCSAELYSVDSYFIPPPHYIRASY